MDRLQIVLRISFMFLGFGSKKSILPFNDIGWRDVAHPFVFEVGQDPCFDDGFFHAQGAFTKPCFHAGHVKIVEVFEIHRQIMAFLKQEAPFIIFAVAFCPETAFGCLPESPCKIGITQNNKPCSFFLISVYGHWCGLPFRRSVHKSKC